MKRKILKAPKAKIAIKKQEYKGHKDLMPDTISNAMKKMIDIFDYIKTTNSCLLLFIEI